jgi:hypothetical protein
LKGSGAAPEQRETDDYVVRGGIIAGPNLVVIPGGLVI